MPQTTALRVRYNAKNVSGRRAASFSIGLELAAQPRLGQPQSKPGNGLFRGLIQQFLTHGLIPPLPSNQFSSRRGNPNDHRLTGWNARYHGHDLQQSRIRLRNLNLNLSDC